MAKRLLIAIYMSLLVLVLIIGFCSVGNNEVPKDTQPQLNNEIIVEKVPLYYNIDDPETMLVKDEDGNFIKV